MTNYERIKNMSVEEMANYLDENIFMDSIEHLTGVDGWSQNGDYMIEWLNQESGAEL